MVTSLLVAAIIILIVCGIGYLLTRFIPDRPVNKPILHTFIWFVVAILCLLVLLGAVTGKGITL